MSIAKEGRLSAAVMLLVLAMALLMGARHMPRLEAPRDLALAAPGESILIDVLANDGVLGDGLVLVQVNRPRHGTAVIEGNQVRYTAASSEAEDRFGYIVQLADGRKAMGVVAVRVESLPAGTPMKGRVPAHLDAGATVRLRVGEDVIHETVTSAGGRFTLVWPAGTYVPEVVMSVEVVGHTLAGVPARWHSVLGTSAFMPYWWPGQEDESHANLRVGPFSTAHHALLSRVMALPGGSPEDYIAHLPSVDPLMMLRLATVFALVAEGGAALPPGQADAYALITDLGAVDAFVDTLPEGVFEARQAALLADRKLIQHYDVNSFGVLLPPGGAGLVAVAGSGAAELFRYDYTLDVPRPSDAIERVSQDGRLRLVMGVGMEQGNVQRRVQCTSGTTQPYRVTRQWDEETLVRLFSGDDLTYLLRVRDVTEVTQAESFPTGCLPEIPGPVVVGERVSALKYDWWASNPRREVFEPGKHYLGAATSAVDLTLRSGWMDVDSQTAGFDGRSVFEPMYWANGWSLNYNLQDQAGGRSYHNAKLMRQSAGAQEWLVMVSTTGANGYAVLATPGVNADPELGVVDFNGVWMDGPTVSDLSMGHPGVNELLVALDVATGTGSQITRFSDGSNPQVAPVWLEVGDTTLSAFAYRTSSGEYVGQCPPQDSGCVPSRRLDWQVLRVLHDHFGSGHHLMWVEERLRVDFIDGSWEVDNRRVMPYMLTGDPVPGMAGEAIEHVVPARFDLDGASGYEGGRIRQ